MPKADAPVIPAGAPAQLERIISVSGADRGERYAAAQSDGFL
jgi:hypothetical protein